MPFTVEQFFDVLVRYNLAIYPAQFAAYLMGIAVLYLVFRPSAVSDKWIGGILALFWIWMGAFYHLGFFVDINDAAYGFGAFFILQGMFFLYTGVFKRCLVFRYSQNVYGVTGALFIAYGMVFYPLIGLLSGHAYPQAPLFGVAPCPTTIFTFGLLLWTERGIPRWVLIIPLLWSLIGTNAVQFGVPEDIGLGIAGVAGTALLLYRERRAAAGETA